MRKFMALVKFKDYYPNHRNDFDFDNDKIPFDSFDVYTESGDKVGTVKDALIDEQAGRFRYLVVDTGFWIFGKNVLLPVGLAHFNYDDKCVYVDGLTKEQVENMPEYQEGMAIDSAYEERVRTSYRPIAGRRRDMQFLGQEYGSTSATAGNAYTLAPGAYNADTYDYDHEPGLYRYNDKANQSLRLYEERLIANKERRRTGEVAVGKRVETRTSEVSIPVEKERVVIERNAPTSNAPVSEAHDFREGEVARMEVYEETANVQKEAFVREEVNVRKEVDRDTVHAQEQLRREEVDIETQGTPNVDRRNIDRR